MHVKLPTINNETDYNKHFRDDAWQEAAAIICERHKISYDSLIRSSQGENAIFFVDDSYVIKIFMELRDNYRRERASLEFARNKISLETPKILHDGKIENFSYIVMTKLAGVSMRDVWQGIDERNKVDIASRLGVVMKELHSHAAPLESGALKRNWQEFVNHQARTTIDRQTKAGANPEWLESLPEYLASVPELLSLNYKQVFLHGDIHPANLLLKEINGRWQLSGLFDFGDSLCGFHEYEFVAPGVLMVQGKRELQRELLLAYGYKETELDLDLRSRLMLLTILYECSNLRKYALRLKPEAVNFTLSELEAAIWTFA